MKKKNIVILGGVLIFAAVLLAVGASFAFFSTSQSVKNTFTMGDIQMNLTEPNYTEKTLVPGSTIY